MTVCNDTRQQEPELANKTADKPKAIDKPATKVNAPQDDEFMPFDELDQILDQEISFSAIDDEPMDTEAALNALDQSPVVEPEKPATTVVSPARPINKPKSGFQPPPTAKEKFEQLLRKITRNISEVLDFQARVWVVNVYAGEHKADWRLLFYCQLSK